MKKILKKITLLNILLFNINIQSNNLNNLTVSLAILDTLSTYEIDINKYQLKITNAMSQALKNPIDSIDFLYKSNFRAYPIPIYIPKSQHEKLDKQQTEGFLIWQNLDRILIDAKNILKAFLLETPHELYSLLPNLIKTRGKAFAKAQGYSSNFRINFLNLLKKEYGLSNIKFPIIEKSYNAWGRVCTYVKLLETIKEKKLSHIRLPFKVILVQNKKTKNYYSKKDAENIIDENLKITINSNNYVFINFKNKDYELILFADIEKLEGKGFSKKTKAELEILCKNAPFDIAFEGGTNGNIFWDKNGDAIIIDTESDKGDMNPSSLDKYPIDINL